MSTTAAGWLAAALGAGGAVVVWRLLAIRMEAVARAVHELRGPLTAARLGLQLEIRSEKDETRRLRAIDLELESAAIALEDLRAARTRVRVGAGRSWPEQRGRLGGAREVDLRELVADSVQAWQAAARTNGVELGLRWSPGACPVLGDRVRLAQATGNLIANAIEHGGGAVEVRGGAQRGRARVEVLDTGPGLPTQVSELTRRARRRGFGADRQRLRAGRGRGLAIAAEVAMAHGGRLSSAPSERGARLVLELPLAMSPGAASGEDPIAS